MTEIKTGPSSALKAAPAWGQTKVTNAKGESVGRATPPAPILLSGKSAGGGSTIQASAPTGGAPRAAGGAPGPAAPLAVPIAIGKPVGREILARHLNQAGVATAVGLGFSVAATSKKAVAANPSLVRLVPPNGMSQAEAQRLLHEAMPAGEFFRNMIYRPIKPETGSNEPAGVGPIGPGASGSGGALAGRPPSCPENRCYAVDLMAWDRSKLAQCEMGRKIGVIDTGHDGQHSAFAGSTVRLARIAHNRAPITANWHGTGVLAILAGNPASATPGLIPNAEFILADVFFGDGRGQPISDTASLLDALRLMSEFGVEVVNLSLSGPRDPAIEQEIARMTAKGVVFVAAAGNDGPTASPSYPAAYKSVIAVTAVNSDGFGYRHANQGDYIDMAAPGVGIWTAAPGDKQAYVTGTSFATPYVTAVMAVMMGEIKGWSKDRILDRIKYQDLGAPGKDSVFGRGVALAPTSCSNPRLVTVPGKRNPFDTTVIARDEPRASLMRVKGPEQ